MSRLIYRLLGFCEHEWQEDAYYGYVCWECSYSANAPKLFFAVGRVVCTGLVFVSLGVVVEVLLAFKDFI